MKLEKRNTKKVRIVNNEFFNEYNSIQEAENLHSCYMSACTPYEENGVIIYDIASKHKTN